ncbi:MAG: elongation factor Tu [Rhodospirillaceae bacterium]|nr:elongation factor Tu [Rhodospirillaceae bacterium]
MPEEKDKVLEVINGYIDQHGDGKYFLNNSTPDFKFIRPSGNPVDANAYSNMFESGEVVVSNSALGKLHKLEIYNEIAFVVFTQTASFTYKNKPNEDVFTVTALLKKENEKWKFSWFHRSSGDADINFWT